MKIFFSYPRKVDEQVALIERIMADLQARGHEVWFDKNKIRTGEVWRNQITRGILDSEKTVAFLSEHATREDGVCLSEIAIVMDTHGEEALCAVLVEPESAVNAPSSVMAVQLLRMEDYKQKESEPGWYAKNLDSIIQFIENPHTQTRTDELSVLRLALNPLRFNADIGKLVSNFTGRKWLFEQYADWLNNKTSSTVFRIEGNPGMGKSAIAASLSFGPKHQVMAVHFCKANENETINPIRMVLSLAFQIACRLPDYRAVLMGTQAIKNTDGMKGLDAASLWRALISEPLAPLISRQRMTLVIDGLDEATQNGTNGIVDFLASGVLDRLPKWVGVVLTGRPDPELQNKLSKYKPQVVSGADPRNLADLAIYIDGWLEGAGYKNEAVKKKILDASDGAFQYVKLLRGDITQEDGRLDLDSITHLPRGLDSYFLTSFERRFPLYSDTVNMAELWEIAKKALSYLMVSPAPLPKIIFRELMGWSFEDDGLSDQSQKSEILLFKTLGSLIEKREAKYDEITLTLCHKSLFDWLSRADPPHDYYVPTKSAQKELATNLWLNYQKNESNPYIKKTLPLLIKNLNQQTFDKIFIEFNSGSAIKLFYLLAPKFGESRNNLETINNLLRYFKKCNFEDKFNQQMVASLHDQCGDYYKLKGEYILATAEYTKSANISNALLDESPNDCELKLDLSTCYINISYILNLSNKLDEAKNLILKAIEIRENIYENNTNKLKISSALGDAYYHLGLINEKTANTQDAFLCYKKSKFYYGDFDLNKKIASDSDLDVIECNRKLGDAYATEGEVENAQNCYKDNYEITKNLFEIYPNSETTNSMHGLSSMSMANQFLDILKFDEALPYLNQSNDIFNDLLRFDPLNSIYLNNFIHIKNIFSDVFYHKQDFNAALDSCNLASELFNKLPTSIAQNINFQKINATTNSKIGKIYLHLNDHVKSKIYFEKSLQTISILHEEYSFDFDLQCKLSAAYLDMAKCMKDINPKIGLEYCIKGLPIIEKLTINSPTNIKYQEQLLQYLQTLVELTNSQHHYDQAWIFCNLFIECVDEMRNEHPATVRYAIGTAIARIYAYEIKNNLTLRIEAENFKIDAKKILKKIKETLPVDGNNYQNDIENLLTFLEV